MDIQEIINMYEQEEKIAKIAKKSGKTSVEVRKDIYEYYRINNIENPVKKVRKERRKKLIEDIEIIYERLQSGEEYSDIERDYKLPAYIIGDEVLKYCFQNNKSKLKRKSPNRILTQQDIEEIVEEYKNEKTSIEELADKYNVVPGTIKRYLPVIEYIDEQKEDIDSQDEINDEIQDNNKDNTLQIEYISKVIEFYEQGKNLQYIKNKLNITYKEIRMILMNYMDIKNKKLSKKSIEVLENLGYDLNLIKKVAQNRNIEVETQDLKQSKENDIQL